MTKLSEIAPHPVDQLVVSLDLPKGVTQGEATEAFRRVYQASPQDILRVALQDALMDAAA